MESILEDDRWDIRIDTKKREDILELNIQKPYATYTISIDKAKQFTLC